MEELKGPVRLEILWAMTDKYYFGSERSISFRLVEKSVVAVCDRHQFDEDEGCSCSEIERSALTHRYRQRTNSIPYISALFPHHFTSPVLN